MSLLNKRLEFKAIALRNALATTLGGAMGLALTHLGWGVNALVAMHVVNAMTGCVIAFLSSGWRPEPRFDFRLIMPVRDVALHALGTRVVEAATSRLDQLLIGSFFGAAVLGLYALAVRFFDVIFQTLCGPMAVVLFSYLAQAHQDLVELRKRYLGILRNLALLAPAVFLLAALILPDVLSLLFGEKWSGVTPYLRIILGAGAVLAVTFSHTPVFAAIGQPRINFLVSTIASAVWLVSLMFLPKLGALFAAVVWVIRAALGIPIQLYFLRSVVKLNMADYGRAVGPGVMLLITLAIMYGLFSPPSDMGMPWRFVNLFMLSLAGVFVVLVFGCRYSLDIRGRVLKLVQFGRVS
jgi:O-antigen/teichoic acid export membrane protein